MPEYPMTDLHYVMEVEPLDLGADVKAVGLDLMEVESREPARGSDATRIWAATLGALTGTEPWVLDFFAHIDRVRGYCRLHEIAFEEKISNRCLVIPTPSPDALSGLIERFASETFGARAGTSSTAGDTAVEGELARHGVDAYHPVFRNYLFCAVCDLENGFLTLLSEHLWASEVIRRSNAALSGLQVDVTRPA